MSDVVVTVPRSFGLERWIDEGDPAGEPWSGEEWDFYLGGARPRVAPGARVYVVYNGALRGYAPLVRIASDPIERWRYSLVRHGGAMAVTVPEFIQGFRGWRYRWWERDVEVPFPDWQDPNACIGFTRPLYQPPARKSARTAKATTTSETASATRVATLWEAPEPDVSIPASIPASSPVSATRVVHVRRDEFDIYIGRPMPRYPELHASGWGNPHRAGQQTPEGWKSAIDLYREWLRGQPQLLARLPELRGQVLGCWCAPKGGLPGDLYGHVCHGEVLAALADRADGADLPGVRRP